MKPGLKFIFLLMFVLSLSCKPESEKSTSKTTNDTGSCSFPGIDYDEVKVLSLDNSIYFLGGELYKNQWLINGSFLDSSGNPLHQKYIAKTLSKKQVKALSQILTVNCSYVSLIKDCAPFYRDAIVFYEKKKPLAFINICFECEQAQCLMKREAYFCVEDRMYPKLINFFVKIGLSHAKKVNLRMQSQLDTLREEH
jgi:hypothetical protein